MWEEWEAAYSGAEQDAGEILKMDGQDRSLRSLLRGSGWKPKPTGDTLRQAIEWYDFDFEYAYPAEQSSGMWSVVVSLSLFLLGSFLVLFPPKWKYEQENCAMRLLHTYLFETAP